GIRLARGCSSVRGISSRSGRAGLQARPRTAARPALDLVAYVDTLPPVPSLPELFVLFRGGLLLPGFPVALGAIRCSSSSTFRRTGFFISMSHLRKRVDERGARGRARVAGEQKRYR